MECPVCKSPSPDGKKFCGECGNPVDQSISSLIAVKISESLDEALDKKLKEYKQTEVDITERVSTRILGWAKTTLAILGIPIVILGAFGAKGVWDINTQKESIEKLGKETKTAADGVQNQLTTLKANLGEATPQVDRIRKEYEDLDRNIGPLHQIRDDLNKAAEDNRNTELRVNALQEKIAGFQPVPHPQGSLHLSLDKVLGADAVQKIRNSGSMTFQTVGATGGVKDGSFQAAVAQQLNRQFRSGDLHSPAFLYLLGNIVFYNGETEQYYKQFYEPYREYPAPIFAVPGNHDGDPSLISQSQKTLEGFLRTFCAASPVVRPESGDAPRKAMIQPNVYWTLDTPFATLIGLYTNVPSGGVIDAEQEDWFRKEMKSAPPEKALIVMMNHPPYSVDEHHSGSVRMSDALEGAIRYSGREPDAVFSADVFNYQRFTLRRSGRDSLYFVAGVGGYYHLHHLSKVTIPDASLGEKGLTLESAYVQHGFVQVTVSSTQLVVRYLAVEKSGSSSTSDVRDSVVFDLHRHVVISSGAR